MKRITLFLIISFISFSSELIKLDYNEVFQGDFLILRSNKEYKVESDLKIGDTVFVKENDEYSAIIPINYRTRVGEHYLKCGEEVLKFKVKEKKFETQKLTVTKKQEAKRTDSKWSDDKKYINEAKSKPLKIKMWTQNFIQPVEGRISTEFGLIRYINGKESGRHSGIDIAAPRGTTVKASNRGKVVLARYLNVTGNTVIIDHGYGLFTAYSHMDSMNVEVGEVVERGMRVGEVGTTGFSTGPHLHFTYSINSTFINPWKFFGEKIIK